MSITHLKEVRGKKLLMVHDKPFIMLSGEVHNSNSSSLEYMEQVWEKAKNLGMNSLLLPITWELLEPEEGVFDFKLVDGLIEQARKYGMRISFLWFGAWKNAQCYYAPEWVKTDLIRFKRAEMEKGKKFRRRTEFYDMPYTTLSYLCEETNKADAKAFRALMAHIKDVDEQEQTVIVVQVENEPGVMGFAREHSDEADALFAAAVPQDFADAMRAHTDTMAKDVRAAVESGKAKGSWEEVFGEVAEEIFSAYYVSSYINKVAAAGKEVYPLPLSANCWLDKGEAAGKYPSGGPVSRMMEVWKYCAPSIDIIAPDIYVPNFCEVCDQYVKMGNPLFIPETATHSYAGPRQVYVVGHYHALCYSPFGFEEMGGPFTVAAGYLFGMDTTDPALATPQDPEEYAWFSKTLNEMMPVLTEKYGTSDLQAVTSEREGVDTMLFGDYGFKAIMNSPRMEKKDGVCLALKSAENEFYVIANRCMLLPITVNPEKPFLDILSLEEGEFEDGQWKRGRRLNGDEVSMMTYDKPTLLKIKLFAYN